MILPNLNFQKMLAECETVETELRSCLSITDVNTLRADMQSLGQAEWLSWSYRHAGSIAEFLAEPPSIRRRQPAWQTPALRQRFLLAAIQRVRQGRRMLLHIDRHCLFPWAGGTSRDFAIRAAQALDDATDYPESLWPFGGPDPFESADELVLAPADRQG